MIEKNHVLEVAGVFAGDPVWQELREEIKRNREEDQRCRAEPLLKDFGCACRML